MTKSLQQLAVTIPVTNYLEYQEFLKDLYLAGKAHFHPYSYLRLAEDLGFSATNVLRLVIARKRKLSPRSAKRIADALGLKHKNRQYFLDLVRFNNMPKESQKSELFLKVLDKKAALGNQEDRALITYFSQWTHPVIRELIRLQHFEANADWLKYNLYPTMTEEELHQSLDFLCRQGLITWNEAEKRYAPVDTGAQILSRDAVSRSLSVLSFHQQMIELAKQLILTLPKEQREYNALTLRLSPEKWERLVSDIRSLCANALAYEQDPHEQDVVVQLNVQLFPYTKIKQIAE